MHKLKQLSAKFLAVLNIAALAGFAAVPVASAATHAVGQNINDNGTIYMILNGPCKAGYTSAGAFLSYGFNSWGGVVEASAEDRALPACNPSFIAPAPGTIIFSDRGADRGTGYFMALSSNGGVEKRGFTSAEVFTGLGYSFANGSWADVSWMQSGSNIDNASAAHPAGSLVNQDGTIYFITSSGKIGIPDIATFNTWGMSFTNAVIANSADRNLSSSSQVLAARQPGQLVPTTTAVNVPNDGPLQGTAGSIDEYSLVSTLSNEQVGEGRRDVDVAGLRMRVSNDSDIRLTSVRLVFDEGTADRRFNRYADEVTLWLDGVKVGEVDASEFTSNNNWTQSVSLDPKAVIRRGQIGELVVAISAVSNIDSADEGETWTVDFRQIRFMDADNVGTTEDPNTDARTFSFESFASAGDVEMKLSLNKDDTHINEAHVIDIDDNDETSNVELLSFVIEAKGDSDLQIEEIPVLITTTENDGAHFDDPDDVISEVSLWLNGKRIATEALPTNDANDDSDVVEFGNLDLTIDAGEEAEFVVKAELVSTGDALDNGDTVRAQITATERDLIDVEDERGNDVTNRTGTASAEASVVYDAGIMVEFVSASESKSFSADDPGESDMGQFKITFKATAFDGDMRIDRSCENIAVNGSGDAGEGVVFSVSDAGATVVSCLLSAANSDSEDNSSVYEIDEGVTRTFTLTVNVSGDNDFVEVALESLNWGQAQNNSNNEFYTFNLSEFKTDTLFLSSL